MFRAPLNDMQAALERAIDLNALRRTARFAEASPDTVSAVLAQAGKIAETALAPLNHLGDQQRTRLQNGVARTPDGFQAAYAQLADGGWVGLAADRAFGGMGLPLTVQTAVNELFAGGCLSLSLCPLLSQGAIHALSLHGSDAQKAYYLPKLISGRWNGAMNMTEPGAGTDVGAARARAEPVGDGSYRITGSKIWISWGDSDLCENVVHLVLARLPDAPPGSKGLSLFVAPKFLPGAGPDDLGPRNALWVVSLEEKLGLHASPTCAMSYDGATAWLVGAPHKGMRAMFTMMNNARLGVGTEGVGVAEAATQKALAYARARRQGRTALGAGDGPIFDHPDVRRMLAEMRAKTRAARAICLDCALHLDLAEAAETDAARAEAAAMGAFLTPIAKAYGADIGCEVAQTGIQVHGGYGYVEQTGAAQFARDVRVTAIYEGTNGVQALDLVGRKLADEGRTARRYLQRVRDEAAALAATDEPVLRGLAPAMTAGAEAADRATAWMLERPIADRGAGSVAYLRLMAHLGGAMYLAREARRADGRLVGDAGRAAVAAFFAREALGEGGGQAAVLAEQAMRGAAGLAALDAEALGS